MYRRAHVTQHDSVNIYSANKEEREERESPVTGRRGESFSLPRDPTVLLLMIWSNTVLLSVTLLIYVDEQTSVTTTLTHLVYK